MEIEQRSLSRTEYRDSFRLIRSENVEPTTFRSLIERYGSASSAIEASPEFSRRGGKKRSGYKFADFYDVEDRRSLSRISKTTARNH